MVNAATVKSLGTRLRIVARRSAMKQQLLVETTVTEGVKTKARSHVSTVKVKGIMRTNAGNLAKNGDKAKTKKPTTLIISLLLTLNNVTQSLWQSKLKTKMHTYPGRSKFTAIQNHPSWSTIMKKKVSSLTLMSKK